MDRQLTKIKRQLTLTTNKQIWLPPPDFSISQWADAERKISPDASAEPGRWNTSRAEYQREIMDAISDPLVERVVVMSAAQVGKTELLLNTIGYYITQEPCPILVLYPTIEMGEAFSKERLAPMLRDTPALQGTVKDPRARDSGNTLRHKTFPGGHITISGANSPASLASRPIRVLLCDEVDRYPDSAGTEGDPITLAMKRTQNFWNRRIVWVSTPTLLQSSKIYQGYEMSSQEEWCVPCPKCGEFVPFDWCQISYKDLQEPVMTCPKCGAIYGELQWKEHMQNGKWIAKNPDEKKIRGFHLNAFASPWATWTELVNGYKEALRGGEESIKGWWNTALGLPYENTGGSVEAEELQSHCEKYNAELPDGVLILTCGVDTQDDRLECEIVGWGIDRESWGIEYRIFYGDPGGNELWQQLDDFLSKTWSYANGDRLGLSCTCIDSAGHFTDEVYRFCKGRARRNIFAIVGRGREGLPSVSKPSRSNKRRVPLYTLGVNTIKGVLFSRLKKEERGAGYCHFPLDENRGYDSVYFKGLVSERMVVKRLRGRNSITWEVRAKGVRNEPLDARVYATGALEIVNPDFVRYAKRREREKGNSKELEKKIKIAEPMQEEKQEKQVKQEKSEKKAIHKSTNFFIRRGLQS